VARRAGARVIIGGEGERVNAAERGSWSQMVLSLWKLDQDIQREFPNASDFFDWVLQTVEQLIRSAEGG